jgi:hypothetical protein
LALWGMLFAAPVLSLYIRTINNSFLTFNWTEILIAWKLFAIYLTIFLIHNFLLAPLLIYRRKRVLYAAMMAALFSIFVAYQCSQRPKFMVQRPIPMERHMDREHGEMDREHGEMDREHEMPRGGHEPHMMRGEHQRPPREFRWQGQRPPVFIGQHDIVAVVILVLMFGMNIGIKLFFKNRTDQKKLAALQKKNLEQQLEYLKYQINPHFFMNTLNNIHALVDIDPEKAKDTILELSKMMRFILYEGDKSGVPLTREFDFIRHYVALMQLRYTNKVEILVDLPSEAPDKTVPPLMLISFIENAFKHGISQSGDGEISLVMKNNEDNIICEIVNTNYPKRDNDKSGSGIGLEQVDKRLELMYPGRYKWEKGVDKETNKYYSKITLYNENKMRNN